MSSSSSTSSSPPPGRLDASSMASQDLDKPGAIVIRNIPFNVKQESLLEIIASLSLPTPYSFKYSVDQRGSFYGLAFACFRSASDADAVVAALNGFNVQGHKLRVKHRKVPDAGERKKLAERDKPSIDGSSLSVSPDRPDVASTSSLAAMTQARQSGTPELDFNDPFTLDLYTRILLFRDDVACDKLTFPKALNHRQQRAVHRVAQKLGVNHYFVGEGEKKYAVVTRFDPESQISAATVIASQSSQPLQSKGNVTDLEFTADDESWKPQRRRTTQSCSNCHVAKRKCDRKRPCQRCVQLGLTDLCAYDSDLEDPVHSAGYLFERPEQQPEQHSKGDMKRSHAPALRLASTSSLREGYASIETINLPSQKRRIRTTSSCLNCHAAKRKCDRKRPCQRCIQLGLTGLCVYASDVDDPVRTADHHVEKPGQQLEQHSKAHVPSLDIRTSHPRVPGLAITNSPQEGHGDIELVDSRSESVSSDSASLFSVENPSGSSGSALTIASLPTSTGSHPSKGSHESSTVHARLLADGNGVGRGFGTTKTQSKDIDETRTISTSLSAVSSVNISGYEDDEDDTNVDVKDQGYSDYVANVSPSFSPTPAAASAAGAFLSSFQSPTTQGSLPDREGDIVSGFTLGPIIGYGASSTIRKAFAASGGVVAVKIINSSDHWKGEKSVLARKQIQREVSIWSTLSHEHILPLFSAIQIKHADYFFTIYCPSGTLLDVLKRDGSPALPQDDAGMMFRQVVKGLQYLHEIALLVHGDIKLDNVLVDESGACRIKGFGMARRIRKRYEDEDEITENAQRPFRVDHTTVHPANIPKVETSGKAFTPPSPVSHPGLSLVQTELKPGSLPYTAPELLFRASARPSIPHPAQDIWALGVLLHGLLTGDLPFTDAFDPRLRQKILNGTYEVPPGIGYSAERVLQGCLHRSQSSRWTISMVDEVAWGIGWSSGDDDHTSSNLQEPRPRDASKLPRSLPQASTTPTDTDGWQKPSQTDDVSSHRYSVEYITADQAYAHVTSKASEFRNALVHLGFEGTYSLHAGFNEEMACLGQRQEEIYIILDSAISGDVCGVLEGVTSPFPGVVYTPEEIHFISTATPKLKNITDGSILLLSLSDTPDRRTATDGATSSGGSKDGVASRGTGDKKGKGKETNNEGDHSHGQDDRGRGEDDDEDVIRRGSGGGGGGGGSGGGGGGGGDGGGGGGRGTEEGDDRGPRMINVPFSSTLSVKPREDSSCLPTKFTTTSSLDITINSNHKATSPPPDSKWSGPWFGVDIAKLSVSTRNITPNLSSYTLGLSQIRIAASSCPTSVIQWSPDITHAEEDTVKAKRERNTSLGGWLTLAASPNARLGGTSSRTDGTEGIQRRWQIMVHELSAGDGPPGADEYKGVQWQYTHNEISGVFKGVTAESPKPRPSVVFGFNKMPDHFMPLLEVTMVVYWSLNHGTSNGHSLLQSFPFRRSKDKEGARKGIPAFLNLLHHVSVVVDLGKVGPGRSWIVNGDAADERTVEGLAESKVPIILKPLSRNAANGETFGMPSNTLKSDCEILVRQAVQGRVAALTEGERAGAMLLLPISGSGTASSPVVLPTPPPSPQPPVYAAGNSPSSDPRIAN